MSTPARPFFIAYPLHAWTTPLPAPAPVVVPVQRLRRWPWVLGGVLAAVLVLRLSASWLALWYCNHALAGLTDVQGHAGGVSLGLWRGVCQVHDITLETRPQISPAWTLSCPSCDIALVWRRLLDAELVGSVTVSHPQLTLTRRPSVPGPHPRAAPAAQADRETWQQQLQGIVPILLTSLQVADCHLTYDDPAATIHLDVGRVTLGLTNLTNHARASALTNRVISVLAIGTLLGHADLHLSGEVDPYPPLPTFTLRLQVEHADLTALDPVLRAYEQFDLRQGTAALYAEVHSEGGILDGYLKPLITDLQTVPLKQAHHLGVSRIKEAVVSLADRVVRNEPKDRVAGQSPLHGDLTAPTTQVWPTVASILANGFIHALAPGLDHQAPAAATQAPPQQAQVTATAH